MSKKKKEEKDPLAIKNPLDKLKLEIAEELGLIDKIKTEGWANLSAAESGRIGGLMTKRLKNQTELN
ncbi:MAG: small, acid-soluble spore protein, alpha/beta type [Bacillota bacterium]|nr:small, acid-soluble spore protein, alpha/beta type [Bacillota bacterium]